MKNKLKVFTNMLLGLVFIFVACEEEEGRGPINPDGTIPNPVTEVEATPIPGGGIITYKLPTDVDLLGVRVDYVLPSGEEASVSASLYSNKIEVLGLLDDSKEITVTVVTFDTSGNESPSQSVKFTPLEAPVVVAANTLNIVPDFGGARFSFENPTLASLDMFVMVRDDNSDIKLLSTRSFADELPESFTERGFDVSEREFMAVYRDRWGNLSDTIKAVIKPLFEEMIPKEGMARYHLPHDVPVFGGGLEGDDPSYGLWFPGWFYDGVIDLVGPSGFRTLDGPTADTFDPEPLPEYRNQFDATRVTAHIYTMDMGVSAKLSRFTYHPLTTGYFAGGGWRIFDVWGTNEEPNAEGTFDGWTLLMDTVEVETPANHKAKKDEIITNGVEFVFDSGEPYRYIRFAWKENYTPIKSFNANEITFYGKVNN